MNIPSLQWLKIVKYGNLFDIPRYILALDRNLDFWVMDCPFREEIDSYAESYHVFHLGTDSKIVRNLYGTCAAGAMVTGCSFVGEVPVENVEFDPTRENSLFLHKGPVKRA